MARKDDELLQTGRRPSPGRNHGRGTPRIIWGALLVALIGAFLLFRQPGGGEPSGIGENRSVITVPADDLDSLAADLGVDDATGTVPPAEPRSGQVEMKDIAESLTPEVPAGGETAPAKTPPPEVKATVKPTSKPKPAPAKPAAETETIIPAANGPYLVQTGSFGDPDNADREARRLQKLGWDARVKVSSTADGGLIYRVRIGYFPSRDRARAFIRQNKRRMPGAIAVHR